MQSFQDPAIHVSICHAHSCNICPLMPSSHLQSHPSGRSPFLSSKCALSPPGPRPSVSQQPAGRGCAVGITASGASAAAAQPGQDAGTAGPPAVVVVTAAATRLGSALVPLGAPHIQGTPSILVTLSVSPQVASWHLGAGLALSTCQTANVLIVTLVGTQVWPLGCSAGGAA